MRSLLRKLLRPVRPAVVAQVDAVVAPVYARRDELAGVADHMLAINEDIRRLLNDDIDAANEAKLVLSRQLAAVTARLDEIAADVSALREAVEREAVERPG